jgi:hypothetical protein
MENEQPVRRITNSKRRDDIGEPAHLWRSLKHRLSMLTLGADAACQSGLGDSWCDWRRNGWKAMSVNRGDLTPIDGGHLGRTASGVRALIVAMKSRNGDGAKGGRKVDA